MNIIINILMEISITSSILITVILIVRKLFRHRISASIQYGIWLLVVLRLMMPFSIPSPMSVMNMLANNKTQLTLTQSPDLILMNNQVEKTGIHAENAEKEKFLEDTSKAPSDTRLDGTAIAVFTWIIGIICTAAYMIFINVAYFKKITANSMELPKEKIPLLKKTAAELKINKDIPAIINDSISSPCLIGCINPRIVMTSQALENENFSRYVFLHELCHYKQKDNFSALLRNLCCAVYWFNPFVWIAAIISRHDGELACDKKVLNYLDYNENICYGEALLKLIRINKMSMGVMHLSTTMTSGGKKMNERIDQIIKQPKTLKLALTGVIMILLAVSGITLSSAMSMESDTITNDTIMKEYADLEKIASYKTPYIGDASKVGGMIGNLPQPSAFHIQNMFSLQTDKEPYGLTVYYEMYEYENEIEAWPFFYSTMDNNALILFTYIDNVEHITFAFRDTPSNGNLEEEEYLGIYEYSRADFIQRFGDFTALQEDLELFNSVLIENLKIDSYRIHYNRIRFEDDYEYVVYRNGSEPDEIVRNNDGSYEMIYKNLGEVKYYSPDNEYTETIPGIDITIYLDGGGIQGVYAAYIQGSSEILWNLGLENDLTYEGIIKKLGQPQIIESDNSSISYLLFDSNDRYVTFLFDENGNLTSHGFDTGYNPSKVVYLEPEIVRVTEHDTGENTSLQTVFSLTANGYFIGKSNETKSNTNRKVQYNIVDPYKNSEKRIPDTEATTEESITEEFVPEEAENTINTEYSSWEQAAKDDIFIPVKSKLLDETMELDRIIPSENKIEIYYKKGDSTVKIDIIKIPAASKSFQYEASYGKIHYNGVYLSDSGIEWTLFDSEPSDIMAVKSSHAVVLMDDYACELIFNEVNSEKIKEILNNIEMSASEDRK